MGLNVLTLLHPKLPSYIKDTYAHKFGKDKRLMDFKTEILTKAKNYIQEIETGTISKIQTNPNLNYVYQAPKVQTQTLYKQNVQRNQYRPKQQMPRPNTP